MEDNNQNIRSSAAANDNSRQIKENDSFTANDRDDDAGTDKYLAMEQPGVTYTRESRATMNSDQEDYQDTEGTYDSSGQNTRNADAFSQDDYILRDNIDLDEDQNQSISSEDNDK